MTTITSTKTIKRAEARTWNLREALARSLDLMSQSVSDMIITVTVLTIMIIYTGQLIPDPLASQIIGMEVLGMTVQLMIRIVRRFDDHYTTDELAERLIEMEAELSAKLERINTMLEDLTIAQVAAEEK